MDEITQNVEKVRVSESGSDRRWALTDSVFLPSSFSFLVGSFIRSLPSFRQSLYLYRSLSVNLCMSSFICYSISVSLSACLAMWTRKRLLVGRSTVERGEIPSFRPFYGTLSPLWAPLWAAGLLPSETSQHQINRASWLIVSCYLPSFLPLFILSHLHWSCLFVHSLFSLFLPLSLSSACLSVSVCSLYMSFFNRHSLFLSG